MTSKISDQMDRVADVENVDSRWKRLQINGTRNIIRYVRIVRSGIAHWRLRLL